MDNSGLALEVVVTKKQKAEELVAVVDLQKQLVMPGRARDIGRSATDKLINKKMKTRIKTAQGQGARAYVTQEVAAWVLDYFRAKHSIGGEK